MAPTVTRTATREVSDQASTPDRQRLGSKRIMATKSRRSKASSSSSSSSKKRSQSDMEQDHGEEIEHAVLPNSDGFIVNGIDDGNSEFSVQSIVQKAYANMHLVDLKKITTSTKENLSETMAKTMVGDVMRYILFTNMTKKRCTGDKLRKEVFDVHDGIQISKEGRTAILEHAMNNFRNLFGYALVSTAHVQTEKLNPGKEKEKFTRKRSAKKKRKTDDDEDGDGAGDAEKSGNSYTDRDAWVLLNLMISQEEKAELWKDRDDNDKRGLLLVVLGCIMLNDRLIPESSLHAYLESHFDLPKPPEEKKRGATARNTNNDPFSHSGLILKELEQEGYIAKKRSMENGETVYSYTYGPRALLEIGLPNILTFVKNVTGVQLNEEEDQAFLTGNHN